ncbi:MAG: N-formylglutamate amidohydrolase [Gammaproteobacteria bacterium]|jgi:predicted N-formylglutamate amidohydrolase|nr:N-formylglutamate amidohydrolase [Gammaproteobacteria bacterium]
MLIISCEHASPAIPKEYQKLFTKQAALLQTHKGYDIAALELAKLLAQQADFHLFAETSRLLVELNRSLHHPRLFSELTKPLDKITKQAILQAYYFPYREQIERKIQAAINKNQRVLHLSVHSFTPALNGQERNCDLGLLYDSRRKNEREFCQGWKKALLALNTGLKIRFNYPYSGQADGFTAYLRKQFAEDQYIGIELEINQAYPMNDYNSWQLLKIQLSQSLKNILEFFPNPQW